MGANKVSGGGGGEDTLKLLQYTLHHNPLAISSYVRYLSNNQGKDQD